MIKACCVTGHRDIPPDKVAMVAELLQQEVLQALDRGYRHFISGFAEGVDLIFARIVADIRVKYPVTLEAAIPYAGRLKSQNAEFRTLLRSCDAVKVITEEYSRECYMIRNRYMVDNSDLVLAVHDGRQGGGTAATMRYAGRSSKEIRSIRI